MRPAYGLMSLAVHPLHKKKHAALDLIREFERRAAADGVPVRALLPFQIEFYHHMGYGCGSRFDEYRFPTLNLPLDPDAQEGREFELRLLGLDAVPEMLDCYTRYAERNHGAFCKFSEEERIMASDVEAHRLGCYEPLLMNPVKKQLTGYLTYHIEPDNDVNYTRNTLVVDELIYQDGAVLRQLLSFLRKQADLAVTCVIRSGEEDFYHLLEDPTDTSGNYINFGYLQTNISAVGNMYKVDPELLIRQTPYRKLAVDTLTCRFCYRAALEKEDRSFTVAFRDGTWSLVSDETAADNTAADNTAATDNPAADVTVTLAQGNLSSVLLGACRLSSLVRLGAASISDKAYTDRLSRLLACEQKPFSNNDY